MFISQFLDQDDTVSVVVRTGTEARVVKGATSVLGLAEEAIEHGFSLLECISKHGFGACVDIKEIISSGRILLPITHPDPTHMHLTGTGLTHLGSAATRDKMHVKSSPDSVAQMTDTMKIFQMGIENGRPKPGDIGVQPEWFYKGNGTCAVKAGADLLSPSFAADGGEEPEIAGIYVISAKGVPFRVGYALANEFSDHITERVNYLWLAHSKLRPCSFGPEILIGDLPADVRGTSRILRDDKLLWEKPFVSGEANMSHTLANLEHHHFKYGLFRQPGDVHVHMFGTATLSFADNISVQDGDIFEIESDQLGQPLRNRMRVEAGPSQHIAVNKL